MGVDVLQIADGLLQGVLIRSLGGCRSTGSGGSSRGGFVIALGFLEFLEYPTSEGAEGLQGGPAELLLLPQRGVLPDQTVVFPVEPLAIRALAGLFRHRSPFTCQIPS